MNPTHTKRNWIIGIVVLVVLIGAYAYSAANRQYCWPYCPNMTNADREAIKSQATSQSVSSSTAPLIEVTSPKGGESYRSGDYIPVVWDARGSIDGGFYVELVDTLGKAVKTDNHIIDLAISDPARSYQGGNYAFNSVGYPSGKYKIHISTYGKAVTDVDGYSNDYFTITK
jgi:hypothetical protein